MIIDDGLVVVVGKIMVWEKNQFYFSCFYKISQKFLPEFQDDAFEHHSKWWKMWEGVELSAYLLF